jgi:[acyl-carrier-protein] S-malonyltransferase
MLTPFAVVFPGQGSQSVGMLKSIIETEPTLTRPFFSKASDILGDDLQKLVLEGPAERLNQTRYTQPALLVCDLILWALWQKKVHAMPSFFAGHSFGEYVALVASNALSFEAAVSLVEKRTVLMQQAVPEEMGAMGVVLALESHRVQAICEEVSQANESIVQAVNFNAPGQVVIAGHRSVVEEALKIAKSLGAKRAKLLNVSVPAHSILMKPAADKFEKILENVPMQLPDVPIIQNVGVKSYESVGEIKAALVQQLYSPVRWVDTIQTLQAKGIELLIECGPGKVLTGLHKRISDQLDLYTWNETTNLDELAKEILDKLN